MSHDLDSGVSKSRVDGTPIYRLAYRPPRRITGERVAGLVRSFRATATPVELARLDAPATGYLGESDIDLGSSITEREKNRAERIS